VRLTGTGAPPGAAGGISAAPADMAVAKNVSEAVDENVLTMHPPKTALRRPAAQELIGWMQS